MKIHSKVFKKAHVIKHLFKSFSTALKQAWKIIKISNKMSSGVCEFFFRKTNGDIRKTLGTFNKEYIKKGNSSQTEETFSYWDIEKNSFRSFRIDMLV